MNFSSIDCENDIYRERDGVREKRNQGAESEREESERSRERERG
jgi:hypothetical protein